MSWEPVIGLEVHAQLQTYSKIFSGAPTAYGAAPNTQACAVDIALPGVLPVMNRQAALLAVKFGLAVDARVNPRSIFARKNYFYPDLPKGYQISQYEIPIVAGGELFIDTAQGRKRIGITRAHLEEDAGKSLHEDFHGMTGVDLNRAGTPLLEIVSEPDMRAPAEAVAYLRKLHSLVRYLEICDGNMEEGSFRCDANISVRPMGQTQLGIRTELKNINSFRFVERALEFEIARQIEVLEDGGTVAQETRLYDPATDETRPMRSKEEAHDYRYFPDPDLPPLVITAADLEQARESLPELPDTRRQRFVTEYELSETDAAQLTAEKDTADYFEQALAANACDHRLMANWVTGELASWLNRTDTPISESKVSPSMLGELVRCIQDQTVSGKTAKAVFEAMWHGDGTAGEIIEARGLKQILDTEIIEQAVVEVIADFPAQVAQVRAGEEKVLSFLVGQVMKATSGKANPRAVNEILRQKLCS
ncbi:MAG: Asp-tRNA(Asn)/Glu-tRNA(Gln) amidotransferase subunit GatB [Arenicellales bacterium]|jgi:aspartyl-tRNA(Asn)/glutamyl-tRNA(Gln) amidotransferase subunit B|nr:Asp-tRNA(Asn)/Glu-tRNA(Gln) amidotransferase subunit GatB [Arenicellales bacterium]MDP7563796.1 Asp-tRNA(Asn)/Glu-tRNA(Gln) amidotransferase subunit GatB [Arenicellales bacterium]MEE1559236.1 Asp-tRNA(Asn)/Glu-tRNA(Gln) amidotransferase subunit GatB [Arenicellales bacterium]